jgi:prepilin-type N-terminal cleavage/methylation domain-containing protein
MNQIYKKRTAFTLFELMVVVIIIGVIYALVLGNFNMKNRIAVPKVKDIKRSLSTHWKRGSRIDFYIYDDCSKSTLKINGEVKEDIESDIDLKLFKNIEVYKTSKHGESEELEFPPLLLNNRLHDVCFQYTIFPNGSSSSYMVKIDKTFYIFYPMFEDAMIIDSLSEAKEQYQHKEYTRISIHE